MSKKKKPDKRNNKLNLLFNNIYKKVFKDVKEVLNEKWSYKRKNKFIKQYTNFNSYNEFCKEYANITTQISINKNKKQWKAYYDKARKNKDLKLPPFFDFEKEVKESIYKQNYKFIKSIPKQVLELNKLKYIKTLQDQVLKGSVGRKELEKMLTALGSKYAKVIARTEVSRLQSAVIEERSKKLNVEAYVWLSTNDQRSRPSHKDMNGVVVLWEKEESKKPYLDGIYGHAGEFPNCRCSPEPIFYAEDLPNGNTQKIYDYNAKKVKTIHRKELLSKLNLD